jgi:hypothetical protein
MLVGDTVEFAPNGNQVYIFSDEEYQAFTSIVTQQFQSSMFYSPPAGQNLPQYPVPYLRIAALALDSMAANKSYLASVEELLDVKLDAAKSANALRKQAQAYRDQDDNAGAFMIIEQVNDSFSLYDRYWKQVQRQQGLGYAAY